MTLIGYGGVEGVDDHYICQNSWGPRWGHRGCFKVRCHAVFEIYYPVSGYIANASTNVGQTSYQNSVDMLMPSNDVPMDDVELDDPELPQDIDSIDDMDIDWPSDDSADDMDIDLSSDIDGTDYMDID